MAGQLKAGSNSVPDWTITSVFFSFCVGFERSVYQGFLFGFVLLLKRLGYQC
jgi:hypothetical protein